MAVQNLEIKKTIMDSVQYGLKNVGPLILTVLLYAVTFIVPWLNVGTTIGFYKAVIKVGHGEVINPLDLFDKSNWSNVGDFFLLMGFMSMGITAAALFLFIPAIILGIAWQFAVLFYIDKDLAPQKALKTSYKVTLGEKWTIFWIYLIVAVLFGIVASLFMLIPKVGWVFVIAVYLIMMAVYFALMGVMYKHFSDKADEMFGGKPGCGCHAPEPAPAPAPAPATAPAPEPAPEAPAE